MSQFTSSPLFHKNLKKLLHRQPDLTKTIDIKLQLILKDKTHPSLRLHKLSGNNRWSISINRSIRITFIYLSNGQILLVNIGTHDQVY